MIKCLIFIQSFIYQDKENNNNFNFFYNITVFNWTTSVFHKNRSSQENN